MASRMMHYAIGKKIEENYPIKDSNRFRWGIILPDSYHPNPAIEGNSHFRIYLNHNKQKTMDLTYFRKLYGRKMIVDELYLGYYLHLVQDIVFRNFMYKDYDWKTTIPGNVERLHKDYELLNPYIIEQYELENSFLIPDKIRKEELFQIYPFDLEYTLQQVEQEFQSQIDGKISFFTGEMVDAYIEKAYAICMNEIVAIIQGKNCMDPLKYAWNTQVT